MIALALIGLLGAQATATWSVEPTAVEVGQPFTLRLEVLAPEDTDGLALVRGELGEVPGVALLDERTDLEGGETHDGSLRVTRLFELAAFRPGAVDLAPLLFELPAGISLTGPAPALEVKGLLAEAELAPRPPVLFPPGFVPERSAAPPARWPWFAGLVVLLGGLGAWWLARRRRGAPVPEPPSVAARLAGLRAQTQEAPSDGRTVVGELVALLRTEPALAPERAGQTDEEWARWLAERRGLDAPVRADLDALVAEAAAVKYAGKTPTPWALDEALARAERVLAAAGEGGRR